MNLLFEPVVADAVGRFLQLAATPRARRAASRPTCLSICFSSSFTLASSSYFRWPSCRDFSFARPAARLRHRHRFLRQLAVLAGDLFGLLLRALHVALSARALFLLEPPLCFAKLSERGAGLAGAARISRRSRATHRVGGLPHLLRGLRAGRVDCARATAARAGARPLRPVRRAHAGWRRRPGRSGRPAPAAAAAPLPAAGAARARAASPSARRPAGRTVAAARSAPFRTDSRACPCPA